MLDRQFWDEDAGMVVEEWDEAWTMLDGYRGVNANMHTVEALLAVGDLQPRGADPDPGRARLRARQRLADPRALRRVLDAAPRLQPGRARAPVPAVRRDRRPLVRVEPADARAARRARRRRAGVDARGRAGAVRRGRARGLGGRRRRRVRLHRRLGRHARRTRSGCTGWSTEALAAAATLHAATGDASYAAWHEQWWAYAEAHLDRPRARLLAPRAGPGQPAGGGHLGREAGRLPRVPGDAGAAAARVAGLRPGPRGGARFEPN